mmetsp:Transcript_5447/g.9658  ORF Transcript_5447/g.9658 Transcript_5447/m.9658 type:complete len:266 (+) Transcript_5447:4382-5179(+)
MRREVKWAGLSVFCRSAGDRQFPCLWMHWKMVIPEDRLCPPSFKTAFGPGSALDPWGELLDFGESVSFSLAFSAFRLSASLPFSFSAFGSFPSASPLPFSFSLGSLFALVLLRRPEPLPTGSFSFSFFSSLGDVPGFFGVAPFFEVDSSLSSRVWDRVTLRGGGISFVSASSWKSSSSSSSSSISSSTGGLIEVCPGEVLASSFDWMKSSTAPTVASGSTITVVPRMSSRSRSTPCPLSWMRVSLNGCISIFRQFKVLLVMLFSA